VPPVVRVAAAALLAMVHAVDAPAFAWDHELDDLRAAIAHAPVQTVLDWQNDAFLPGAPTNRYFTNGTHLVVRLPVAASGDDADRRAWGFRLGQDMYTPGDIRTAGARLNGLDRPYAAWLHAGVFRESFGRTPGVPAFSRLSLDLGCLGPCAHGEQAQRTAHAIIGSVDAVAWDRQVRGGPGLQFGALVAPRRHVFADGAIDVLPYASAELGNVFVHGALGATMRFGRFGSVAEAGTDPGQILPVNGGGPEWFLFGRIEARAVGYDATLQGGWFSSSPHTVQPAPLVADTEWGIAWRQRRFALGVSFATRSNVIRDLPHTFTMHRWGRVQLAWQFG